MKTQLARVLNKRDVLAAWENADPILLKGEIAFVEITPSQVKMKVGDGARHFSELGYSGDLSSLFQIHAALPATNPGAPQGNVIWETSTPGIYVHFLDSGNNPITINAGEYARIVDEGAYFTKVLIPLPIGPYASAADVKSVWDIDYPQYLPRPAWHTMINKGANSMGGFYGTPVPVANDWYVDMKQCFDLSRLEGVGVRTTNIPGGDVECQIVTINEFGIMVALGASVTNSTTGGQFTVADMFVEAAAAADPATRPANVTRCYIACRNTSDVPLQMDVLPGAAVWQFSVATGLLVTKFPDTDVSYEVFLYDEIPLQAETGRDRAVYPIRANLGANPLIVSPNDSTILYTSGAGAGSIHLPRFGVLKGKVFVLKRIAGAGVVNVAPQDGATIDGSASLPLGAVGSVIRAQFDGDNYWVV